MLRINTKFSSYQNFLETELCFSFAEASEYKEELLTAFDNKKRETMYEICNIVYTKLQNLLDDG